MSLLHALFVNLSVHGPSACVCYVCCVRSCVHACACLDLDFSVANPGVGVRDSPPVPTGDLFNADITSPGRPLIRSQSFHNGPGK